MEKIKIEFNPCETQKEVWNGYEIEIKPYIDNGTKLYILETIEQIYKERLEEKEENVPLNMGLTADVDVLLCSLQTNVDFDGADYEGMINSGFVSYIKNKVVNYKEVKEEINTLVTMLTIKSLIPDMNTVLDDINFLSDVKSKTPEELTNMISLFKAVEEQDGNRD